MKRFKMRWNPDARAILERAGVAITPEEDAHGFLMDDEDYDRLVQLACGYGISKSELINITVLQNPLKLRAFVRSLRREGARPRRRPS